MYIESEEPDYDKDEDAYSDNSFKPADILGIDDDFTLRGINTARLSILPFRYNPVTKQLRVYRDIQITVSFSGGGSSFCDDKYRSVFFEPILARNLPNYPSLNSVNFTHCFETDETGADLVLIVPNNPSYIAAANKLASWRIKQGIKTMVLNVTTIPNGGNDVNAIFNYLYDAYLYWDRPPSAVLLFGDYSTNGNEGITSLELYQPTSSGNLYFLSDLFYAGLGYPTMWDWMYTIARMPATATEIDDWVDKIIDFESNPDKGTTYFNQPLVSGIWGQWFPGLFPCIPR